jgi:ABC-type nitrate/sulfonate/bicarbonate transport system permease component
MKTMLRRLAMGPTLGIALILLLLLLWEMAGLLKWVSPLSLPRMSAVAVTLWELLVSGELLRELAASLWRMFAGYFIGVALGVLLGLLMGSFRPVYNLFEPITEILRPIPSPAYVPIAILFLGIDDEMKIFMVAFSAFFPVLLNTYSGVKQVDPVQIDTGRTFGLNSFDIVKRIVLPSAIPHVFTGLRISLGIGLIMVVISEMVAANSGIGYFILQAQRSFEVSQMYAGIFTLGVVGYLLNFSFTRMEKKIVHWR